MSSNLNHIVKVFFTILIIIFISGCGSDNPTVHDDPTPKPDDTTNFEGTYTIYEERTEGNFEIAGYGTYDITIEQTGDQAQIINGDQSLSCTVHADELSCNGTITLSNGNRFEYSNYTLFLNNNNLTGSAGWTYYNENGGFPGKSKLTTIQPEVGSILLANLRNEIYQSYIFRSCGSSNWNPEELSNPIGYGGYLYIHDIDPGCYDVAICEDLSPTDGTNCRGIQDITVNRAETHRLINDYSTAQSSLTPNKDQHFDDVKKFSQDY